MKIYIRLDSPYEWVRLQGNNIEAFGEVNELSEYPVQPEDEVIGVIGGQWVTAHKLSLPAKTRKQFNAALPYALEDVISEDVENMHFVCPNWQADQEVTVYAIARQKMQYWHDVATDHQLPVSQLIADYMLLPFHEAANCSVAQAEDQVMVNQMEGAGAKFDLDFIDLWLADVPFDVTVAVNDKTLTEALIAENAQRDIRHWPFGDKMAHWLEHEPPKVVDLFSDEFRPRINLNQKRAWAIPACLVLSAIVLKFGFDAYRYTSLYTENKKIDQQMQDIVKTTFPEIDVVIPSKERFMMEQALKRNTQSQGPINLQTLLADVSKILKRQNVTLSDLSYRNDELVLSCELTDFSQVDAIASQLNSIQAATAKLQSSSADGDKISARYSIRQG